ncbi:type II toxin-antitoxin system RelE/ParE family toxin [Variovorax sp. KK3]|uniref:type II toxin-antitoxin system RelE/ParE family toxin n=1 Tax=Variovorax sp. KK3 TaxID=1855728 RepID=UPI00097C4BB9|nr:type II toxin-antitoxin system RelE/ParE family toxin [Variovorax sp. KK3]
MPRIEVAAEVTADFERIIDHLNSHGVDDVPGRIADIVRALDILELNPFMGRPVEAGKRELLIGRESRAYVALYRFVPDIDTVFVLALRSQRESGFKRPTP